MEENFLEEKPKNAKPPKQVFRLHRRLFLLVFAVAVLFQSVLFLQTCLNRYYRALDRDFKIILTVSKKMDNAALANLGDSLNQKTDITEVKLFSPQDALETVRKQNPQLADSLLLMGKNKMPAYFELRLNHKAINNIRPFVDNLTTEYPELSAKYSLVQADMLFAAGLCAKLLNLAVLFAVLLFLAFMFLVEAYPSSLTRNHQMAGVVSGGLAGLASCAFFALLIYPSGFLTEVFHNVISVEKQLLLLAFCGIFGWTLTKWQKF